MKEEPAEQDIPRRTRSSQKSTSVDTLREGLPVESVESLEEEFRIKELKRKIAKVDEKITKHKILIGISAVGSFLVVTYLFSNYLLNPTKPSDVNLSAGLSLAAGFFAAFLIMAISGIVKEFSIKSGLIEVSSKLEQKIENVQTNIEVTKKEVEDRISTLTQSVNSAIQTINSINNSVANWNQNMQSFQGKMGDQRTSLYINTEQKEEEKQTKIFEGYIKGEKESKDLNNRATDIDVDSAPTKSFIKQQP